MAVKVTIVNPINDHTDILTNLLQIMHDSVNGHYDELKAIFDYFESSLDNSVSMEANFSYLIEGEEKFAFLEDPESKVPSLIESLHKIMKSHTGGDWKKFILNLDANGKERWIRKFEQLL